MNPNGLLKNLASHMRPFQDLTGKRIGRLVVIRQTEKKPLSKAIRWLCKCDCGNETSATSSNLLNEAVRSCGCWKDELRRVSKGKMAYHPLYSTWNKMISRCNKKHDLAYPYYGGRGIKVCERWMDINNFILDMGEKPENTSLDRIDNDGDYEPSNCRWATSKEQSKNRRNVTKLSTEIMDLKNRIAQLESQVDHLQALAASREIGGYSL